MGNFVFATIGRSISNFFSWLIKFFVITVISVLTICFLLAADVVALVVYPFWAWRHPQEATYEFSLADVLDWDWLVDIVNPRKRPHSNSIIGFFQYIMLPIDRVVISLWNAWFLHCSPMKKRKLFIDALGGGLSKLSAKVQRKYFLASDFDREVYLIRSNMLSSKVVDALRSEAPSVFFHAGNILDKDFGEAYFQDISYYVENFDLSLAKQLKLISYTFLHPQTYMRVLRAYIMRRGLHPNAVVCLLEKLKDDSPEVLKSLPEILKYRQDLVTVTRLSESRESNVAEVFSRYLQERNKLGFEAQVAMNSWQYEIFHKLKYRLQAKAVEAKLAAANKNADAERFVSLMMEYGELDDNYTAMSQIAGDAKLSVMWLNHLAK